LLNTLSLISIYIFDLLYQPLVNDQPRWLYRNFGWFYRILWLFPIVGVSVYLNVRVLLLLLYNLNIFSRRVLGVRILQDVHILYNTAPIQLHAHLSHILGCSLVSQHLLTDLSWSSRRSRWIWLSEWFPLLVSPLASFSCAGSIRELRVQWQTFVWYYGFFSYYCFEHVLSQLITRPELRSFLTGSNG